MRLSQISYQFKRFAINFGCYLFDLLVFSNSKATISNHSERKLVVIVRLDAIGDFIIWTDSAKALPKLFPKETHKLILIGNPAWLDLAKDLQVFEEIIPINRIKLMLNWKYRYQIFSELVSRAFDIVLYPSYDQEFGSGSLLIRLLNANQKIGIKSGNAIDHPFWIKKTEKWFTVLHQPVISNPHELIRNAEFIKQLGFSEFEAALPKIILPETDFWTNFKKEYNIDGEFYVVFPGASTPIKQWSEKKFATVCNEIYKKKKIPGIIVGSKREIDLAKNLIESSDAKLYACVGKTSIRDLTVIIRNAKFLIGNDSSGIHIAVAVQTPSFCILGGGHFGRFMPYPTNLNVDKTYIPTPIYNTMPCFHCDWNCKYAIQRNKSVKCISDITVTKVLQALDL